MTGMLFFSGTHLLELVAMSESFGDLSGDGSGDESGGELSMGNIKKGVPGFSFFGPFDVYSSDEFVDVLRTFKQDTGKPVNILLFASAEDANTDSIMVLHYIPKTSQVNIISIPRDTYIDLKGYKFHKINSVYNVKNGPELLKDKLEEILGKKIDYYIHMDMKAVREIVDILGGVEYNVPCDMIYDDPDQNLHINIKKGVRTLTGKQVEGLLRFRKPNKWTNDVRKYYDGSDLKRIERQHDFFSEMLKQKLNIKYVAKTGDIINNIYSNLTTDLPLSEMLKLARGLPGLSAEKFQTATLPGNAKDKDGLSYFMHDSKQSKALADAMFGEK
jgi:LCP family protein required for cell wall assembly